MKFYKIEAGSFHIDGGAAFGVVPKVVWKKRYPCNEDNYCRVNTRCLLIDTGKKKVLIDTGAGDKQPDYLKFYKFTDTVDLASEIEKTGIKCSEITDVIFTHLHFDHCGGATRYNPENRKIELIFPNAVHRVGKAQWETFLNPNPREGDSYFKENVMPIFDAGKLEIVSSNCFISPEIEIRLSDGHTAGQLLTYITHGNKTLVHGGDIIPLAANVPVAWLSSFDTFPLKAMEAKQILLEDAADTGKILFFEHDAYSECGTVERNYNKFRIKETFSLEEVF
jgi:glyoxylase-like metal-dependent hydrolase (beta-lactamase superfamily II)